MLSQRPKLSNLFVSQPLAIDATQHAIGVLKVVGARDKFQILDPVVVSDTVLVVDLQPRLNAKERFRHQTVNAVANKCAVTRKSRGEIPVVA